MEVLQRTANRGSIATGGYDIANSLKFEEDNSEVIATTNQAAGDRKTWTFSAWVKRTEITYDYATIFGAEFTIIKFLGDDRLGLELYNGTYYSLITTQKFRDTSAWYHIVAVCDTTQATASERSRLYVNGERVTVFDTSNSPPLNSEFAIGQAGSAGSGAWLRLGQFFAGSDYFNGYMAEVHYLNGTAAQASDFGEYDSDSGIWIPKEYTGGGYGTQGFYYKFDNASNLGEDSSGEGHDANNLSNITSADQATDTPTNNFCTLNPLDNNWANVPIINEGATNHHSDSANFEGSSGTIAMSSGKWYWEIKTMHSDGNVYMLGIGSTQYGEAPGTQSPHDVLNFAGLYLANSGTEGGLFVTDSTGGSVYRNAFNPGANYSAGDIYGFALDLDSSTQTITFYRNGSNINPSSGAALDIAGACSILPVTVRLSIYEREAQCNFGGYTEFSISSAATDANGYGTFEYAPPTGYYAICTKNLAEYG